MPELPEVESTVLSLRHDLVGRRIVALEVSWVRTLDKCTEALFRQATTNATFTKVTRRAKFIVFHLSKESHHFFLLCHLRMTGSLHVLTQRAIGAKHDRLVFKLDDQRELRFYDPRKFGRFYLTDDLHRFTAHLGPEPLENLFTSAQLLSQLSGKRGAIKPALLNQKVVAGIGNIYADEALWRSQIHPLQPAGHLKLEPITKLHTAIREVLREAIEAHGTDFGDGVIYDGTFRPQVYGRTNEPCHRCGTRIRRIIINQRSSHFCPSCQKRRYRRAKKKVPTMNRSCQKL